MALVISPHSCRCFLAESCRRYLRHLAVVFSVVVEEFVLRHHLRCRKHHALLPRLVASDGDFCSFHVFLHHDVVALHDGFTDGRGELVFVLHLRHTEAAAVGGRLDEARHTDFLLYLVVADEFLVALAYEQAVGHAHSITAQILVEHKLVECHGLDEHATGGVRQVYQFEISLQYSVLARCAVYGDVCVFKEHEFAVLLEREVVAVDGRRCPVVQFHMPVKTFHVYDIHVVAFLVEERVESLRRAQ